MILKYNQVLFRQLKMFPSEMVARLFFCYSYIKHFLSYFQNFNYPHPLVHFVNATMIRASPGRSQEHRSQIRSVMGIMGAQLLISLCCTLGYALKGSRCQELQLGMASRRYCMETSIPNSVVIYSFV